ncbi:MAG: PhzF family phenazine biosynthesis protein [Coriobacteriaceae bacterium]|jgi:PhzF family phenazine biosynthesis protein|nr:MAG: PhzF family phenazine biosynthesis protein [Coriobacteriaceae bacterium]
MKQYIVDAFTEELFCGNPAAVCLVDAWPEDSLMQAIAQENALSETAFLLPEDSSYELRWFTPGGEIDLCGHATLASAFVADRMLHDTSQTLSFETASGRLDVTRRDGLYAMDFPAIPMTRTDVTPEMEHAFGATPLEAWLGEDLVCVFADEDAVRSLASDQEALAQLPGLMQHATARGRDFDCVSRGFGPKIAIPEDPVCGRAHCHIAPLWAARLGRSSIRAFQASRRGGTLACRVSGEHVELGGHAVLFSEGTLAP